MFILISFLRYWGCEVWTKSSVREMILLWMRSSILSQCRNLRTGVICSVLRFQLLREQVSFAVAGDEIYVFTVSLDRVSYTSLI